MHGKLEVARGTLARIEAVCSIVAHANMHGFEHQAWSRPFFEATLILSRVQGGVGEFVCLCGRGSGAGDCVFVGTIAFICSFEALNGHFKPKIRRLKVILASRGS